MPELKKQLGDLTRAKYRYENGQTCEFWRSAIHGDRRLAGQHLLVYHTLDAHHLNQFAYSIHRFLQELTLTLGQFNFNDLL